jgi:hypothetical protein
MVHAAAYVPIVLGFLVLIIWLICHSSPVPIDRAEVEERGLRLLRSWLSPKQAQQWDALNEFEVVGSHTGTRYRIRRGKTMNVHEMDRAGNIVAHWCFAPQGDLPMGDVLLGQKIALETHWCFAPQGDLPMGDVLLGQKIALETMERDALKMARRNHLHVADA